MSKFDNRKHFFPCVIPIMEGNLHIAYSHSSEQSRLFYVIQKLLGILELTRQSRYRNMR